MSKYQYGNDKHAANVICPFYHRFATDGKTIVCEGMGDSQELCMHFSRREDMNAYMEGACKTHGYEEKCCIARLLTGAYEQQKGESK